METWTKDTSGDGWRHWTHPVLGLDAVTGARPRVTEILVVGLGASDHEQLIASIRLARRLATGPLEVVAAGAHPTQSWFESVQKAGADLALVVSWPEPGRWSQEPPLRDVAELGGAICPELHARHEQDVTLSVCGRHRDRMVLVRHHFDRWCLANKEDCPHWQGEPCG